MNEKEFIQTPLQRILEILLIAKNDNETVLPLRTIINLILMSEDAEKQFYVDAFVAGRVHEYYSETPDITADDCEIFDEKIAEDYFLSKYGVEENTSNEEPTTTP